MIEAVDRAVFAGLRGLPNWRGKASVASGWMRRRARDPLVGNLSVRLEDGSTIAAPRGSTMAWTVAACGHWDRHIMRLLYQYVAPETLVLDIGASFGLWTVPLGRVVQSNRGLLWCFEPNPENVRWLGENVARNGLDGVVDVRAVGLASQSGTASLSMNEPGGGNGALNVNGMPSTATVPVARIDDLDLPRRVSFMKLDVEGYELDILRGARETIARDGPVIFGEFNAEWLRIRGEHLQPCLESFVDLGYDVFTIDEERSAPWRPRDRASLRALVAPFPAGTENIVLVPAPAESLAV